MRCHWPRPLVFDFRQPAVIGNDGPAAGACGRRSLVVTQFDQSESLPDHYREMAGKLRELARTTRSSSIRRELVDLARRYDRRGDYFDRWAR